MSTWGALRSPARRAVFGMRRCSAWPVLPPPLSLCWCRAACASASHRRRTVPRLEVCLPGIRVVSHLWLRRHLPRGQRPYLQLRVPSPLRQVPWNCSGSRVRVVSVCTSMLCDVSAEVGVSDSPPTNHRQTGGGGSDYSRGHRAAAAAAGAAGHTDDAADVEEEEERTLLREVRSWRGGSQALDPCFARPLPSVVSRNAVGCQ